MSTPTVQVETRGPVALVTLNRPESSNTINLQMAMDLLAAAMTCARNNNVRAVVLTGAGRNFCFGGDLRAIASRRPAWTITSGSSRATCIPPSRISCAWSRRSSRQ